MIHWKRMKKSHLMDPRILVLSFIRMCVGSMKELKWKMTKCKLVRMCRSPENGKEEKFHRNGIFSSRFSSSTETCSILQTKVKMIFSSYMFFYVFLCLSIYVCLLFWFSLSLSLSLSLFLSLSVSKHLTFSSEKPCFPRLFHQALSQILPFKKV